MLVIDEVQNLLAGSNREQRRMLNLLRFLGNEWRVALVCLGPHEARDAIRGDAHLNSRFDPHGLPSWRYDEDFQSLIGSLFRALPLRSPSELGEGGFEADRRGHGRDHVRDFSSDHRSGGRGDRQRRGTDKRRPFSIAVSRRRRPKRFFRPVRGEATPPLPVVPPPAFDERLSSWLSRTADLYLVSPGELCAHVGLSSDGLLGLDLGPGDHAIRVLSRATGLASAQLVSLTYRELPALARSLVNLESLDFCPTCARGTGTRRAPRLKTWALGYTPWRPEHGCRLYGSDPSGVHALGGVAIAKRGARLLRAWALGLDVARPSTAAVLGQLLTPYRAPAPPERWELARAQAAGFQARRDDLLRPRARSALSRVVPEYDGAVAIHERKLPEAARDLCVARAVEWQAVAIGVYRVIQNPVEAALDILRGCDDHGRRRIEAGLSQWPLEMRIVVADRFARAARASGRRKGPCGA